MNNAKTRVVIVDDHPLLRDSLSQLINFELDMMVCGEAGDTQQALQIIRDTSPNLVIVDITLDQSNGLELIRAIKAQAAELPVLVLSMHEESLYSERSIRAGASGYITKNQPATEVLLAIRRVISGNIYLSEKMTSIFLKSAVRSRSNLPSRPIERLTGRELEILGALGRGISARDIAQSLKISHVTVDTYRARIKEKLNLKNAAELQHFAFQWVREQE
jgi:DNA-binding NarL/FixJ family response regulator